MGLQELCQIRLIKSEILWVFLNMISMLVRILVCMELGCFEYVH